jgi:hypothetical protein
MSGEPKVYRVKIADLLPDEGNANLGTERGRYMLEQSLQQFGAGRSILLDRDGRVIAGNKTREVAGEVGLEDAIVVETDGNELVAVKRTDLDLEEGPAARRLAYYDNRAGEADLAWSPERLLADLEAGVELSDLWRDDELAALVERALEGPPDVEFPEYDESVEDEVEWNECPECGHRWPK